VQYLISLLSYKEQFHSYCFIVAREFVVVTGPKAIRADVIWILGGTPMHTGKVKWFNNAKGFGFIVSPDFGEDLFAHYSVIRTEGYKCLKAGQLVQFDTTPGPKGTHATNIRLLTVSETEEIN